ncbi:MAG: metalloprotease TldD [Betaproteobacteria bacterium TMED41]|nr:MAG: metalloprotease TldD [Betaproteobacteria bacterium TMED41]|tara:strand:- start:771 stop:2261 length:1491 start_codon:yes stop_codon:yes gene_type:complete
MNSPNLPMSTLETAKSLLLFPHGIQDSHLEKAISSIHKRDVDFSDLYFQYTRSESWALDEHIVKSGSFSIDQGVGVRAVSGDKSAFAYSDTLNPEILVEASKTARSISSSENSTKKIKVIAKKLKSNLNRKLEPIKKLYSEFDPMLSLSSKEKIDLLMQLDSIARKKDSRVSQVMASLVGGYDVVLIFRSDGLMVADLRPLVRLSVTVIAQAGNRREIGSSGGGGRYSVTNFNSDKIEFFASEAVRQSLVNLESKPAPAGEMPVVLGPGWPGILLHEAVGHGLEGDFNRKLSSVFSGRVGERVAAEGVTVVDDGSIPNRRGSLNFDDEGNTTRNNVLIENGILKGYLQDSLNSKLMNVAQTGNGRRESYAHLPMPRMTNTFMLSGRENPESIISSLDKGLYAVNFGGGQVDITNGKFVFSASEAYWVEKGKIKYPVKGATLIGNGPDALTKVKLIGNDLKLDGGVGTCGKDGQRVPVGVGQPTLLIEGLTVGGTAD